MLYFGVYDCDTIYRVKPIGKNPILIRAVEWQNHYKKIENINTLEIITKDITEDKDLNILEFNKLEDFIINNFFDEIMVHCSAGISRSSAIMIIISRIIRCKKIEDIIWSDKHLIPNKHILKYEISKYKDMDIEDVYYRDKDVYKNIYLNNNDKIIKNLIIENGKCRFNL